MNKLQEFINEGRELHGLTIIKESTDLNEGDLSFKSIKKGDTLYQWKATPKGKPTEYTKVEIIKPISDEKGWERFEAKVLDGKKKGETITVYLDKLQKDMNESLINEADSKVTIDVDFINDKDSIEPLKKFKIKHKKTGDSTADLTGKKSDLIKYLKSDYFGLDDDDIEDLYSELLEGELTEGKHIDFNGDAIKKGQVYQYAPEFTKENNFAWTQVILEYSLLVILLILMI